MKIELVNETLTAETDGGTVGYEIVRALIVCLHTNKELVGVSTLKLKGFEMEQTVTLSVDLCNEMKRIFRVVALYVDKVGYEVQMSWDKNHPPGSVLP